ncbi:MAG: TIGR01212 family radical SAM protein [Cyanobacteria bacterium]|nr:TIGR01212 family radical SAM protein [Cyanobacteriota bacterium]MDA1021004.1 TIGR01212 family radical SAM protein [Cyanobacteriota bacterium]
MSQPHYYSLKDYLKQRFGGRVQRVTLEGGFTCPNIDGTKSAGGCTFCTDDGSSSGAQNAGLTIKQQLEEGIRKQSQRFNCEQFIAYFQSFTNTYADVDYLRGLYDQAIDHPQVKVLAIGTRPDCVPEEVIDLLEEYTAKGLEVWVDIGVQTSHNITLEKVNRAHTWEDFVDAADRLARRKNPLLRICTHVIIGLPGETTEMVYQTADKLAQCPIDDIKIHQLCVFKGTAMEIDYLNGELELYESEDDYIPIVSEFIRRIPAGIAIQRVMGEGKIGELVAPAWADHGMKNLFLNKFYKYLEDNQVYQGAKVAIRP